MGTVHNQKLIELMDKVVENFTEENWMEVAILSGHECINRHHRLIRSLKFGDTDYGACVLSVLQELYQDDPSHLNAVESILLKKEVRHGDNISSIPRQDNSVVFSPAVFEVPDEPVDPSLVSVMMPFDHSFSRVFQSIRRLCQKEGLDCLRADDIWTHSVLIQDIFKLIFRSHIVICDFTGRNPNVFYEAGIAHTLGKHVIPITQSKDDIPFDLRHHRFLAYLNNEQGLDEFSFWLGSRISSLKQSPASPRVRQNRFY